MTSSSSSISVELTPTEAYFAATVGIRRRLRGIFSKLQDRYGSVDVDPWGIDIEGAGAEMATAKGLGRYWSPALHVQQTGEGDVKEYQVRSTTYTNGSLLIKDGDLDSEIFILVIGSLPKYVLAGWIFAREGKRDQWRRTVRSRSAWFVPQNALRNLKDLSTATSPPHPWGRDNPLSKDEINDGGEG